MPLSKENHQNINLALQQFEATIRTIIGEDNLIIGMGYQDGLNIVTHTIKNSNLEWGFACKALNSMNGQYYEYFAYWYMRTAYS